MMQTLPVEAEGHVADARRRAVALAESGGFSETDAGRVAIVATELATNLKKHGGGGEILAALFADETGSGLELIALDRGRGMADVAACEADGYSSAGSAGQGFGAIRRLTDAMAVASWPGMGTVVAVRLVRSPRPRHLPWPAIGAVSVALAGEEVCGDAWAARQGGGGRAEVLVADGLGHGTGAATAALEAVRVFRAADEGTPPRRLLEIAHQALKATRGAAIATARIEIAERRVVFCGLGNVAGVVVRPAGVRRLVSHNGTAGVALHRLAEFAEPFGGADRLVLHSDGLATSWSLDRYPGLGDAPPIVAAALLYRDHTRGRDDVTVLVAGPFADPFDGAPEGAAS